MNCYWTSLGLGLVVAGWSLVSPAAATEPIGWVGTRAEAVEKARNSGKLILLLAGRETCGNCSYMKSTVCPSAEVRPLLDANYICWFCPVDTSTEWYPYASGLGTFTLPLICVIDPGNPTAYLDRTTATWPPATFASRLAAHLPANPLAVVPRLAPFRLCWDTEDQLSYRLLRSADLLHWEFVGELMIGDGQPTEFAESPAGSQAFYRLMGFR